jgi:hypothetical protein
MTCGFDLLVVNPSNTAVLCFIVTVLGVLAGVHQSSVGSQPFINRFAGPRVLNRGKDVRFV